MNKGYMLEYFGSYSQEAMKVLLHMILMREINKGLFTTEDLSNAIALHGRAISGVMGSFSKRDKRKLVIKAGTRETNWNGRRFRRPQQLWMLNPELTKREVSEIKISLIELLAELSMVEFWCPYCGYMTREDWNGFKPMPQEFRPECPQCHSPAIREIRDKMSN